MKDTNKLVQEYVASIPFDQRLYRYSFRWIFNGE